MNIKKKIGLLLLGVGVFGLSGFYVSADEIGSSKVTPEYTVEITDPVTGVTEQVAVDSSDVQLTLKEISTVEARTK